MFKLASRRECTGCMACVDVCPKNALSSYRSNDGHLYPKVDTEKCIDCGLCSKICPVLSMSSTRNDVNPFDPYAAWYNDKDTRRQSASGGIFFGIAETIINKGGYVVGASLSDNNVKHIIVDNLHDLKLLQGSKYIQGDLSGIYLSCRNLLRKGSIVLFSGTPCQVAGLKSFLRKEFNNLFTIDIICGGFPSYLPFLSFFKKYPNISLQSFRDKETGWKPFNFSYNLKGVDDHGKKISFGNKNVPIQAFGNSVTQRYNCYNCKFATAYRISDITIGDLWGDKTYKDEHFWGCSLIVPHSEKIFEILTESNITYHKISWDDAVRKNPLLISSKKTKRLHLSRIFMIFIYKNFNYDEILNLYLGKGFFGFCYRLNNLLLRYISRIKGNKVLYKIIQNQKHEN